MDSKELRKFYEKLSDGTKAKLKACRTEEEMKKILEDEQIEIPPELLEAVAGGVDRESMPGRSNSCFCY
jgi:hypothetical protein